VAAWPEVRLPDDEAGRFLNGLRRRVSLADAAAVRVYRFSREPEEPDDALQRRHTRAFLGTAHITAGELIADRLLSLSEIQEVQEIPS
jgi:tRNA pseudouridine55 synthase